MNAHEAQSNCLNISEKLLVMWVLENIEFKNVIITTTSNSNFRSIDFLMSGWPKIDYFVIKIDDFDCF